MAESAPRILTVTELNRLARDTLERAFPLFWVSGEISNLTRAASGHWYFSLKDAGAQVRCVMFRGRNSYLDWQPREGDKVEARALVTLYEARGDFQLTIEFLQRAGLGTLFEAFEKLKAKLQAEGLFDSASKRPIPAHPQRIGIVTSPDAAALRDVLSTLRRRMPSLNVIIYPTPVQGKGAAAQIAAAIETASARAEVDVLIVCRGGGSMEDLWQFNEEIVARAIHGCSMPVISGVGHETDFTIADFAADVRAATPTAAAELVSADRQALLQAQAQLSRRLSRAMQQLLNQRMQHMDYLTRRLLSPSQQIAHRSHQLQQWQWRLQQAMRQRLDRQSRQLQTLQQNLQHLNPQAILSRGYTLAYAEDGSLLKSVHVLAHGEEVKLQFADGQVTTTVDKIYPQ